MIPSVVIAQNTYRELVRGKILYLVFFFAIVIVIVSAFFGSVTIGDREAVVKDFGLFAISLFSTVFVVIAGSTLVHKEVVRKTVFNLLSKPVTRSQFLWGKFLGITAVAAVLVAAMCLGLAGLILLLGGKLDLFLIAGAYSTLVEVVVVSAAAMFFSSLVVTPVLAGLFTFGLFLSGRSVEYLLYFVGEGTPAAINAFLKGLYFILPHLSKISIGSAAVTRDPGVLSAARFVWIGVYGAAYALVLLMLASLIFDRRDIT